MTKTYKTKHRPFEYRLYCDSCHALLSDSAPGKEKLPWGNPDNICPKCKGKINNPDVPEWEPED